MRNDFGRRKSKKKTNRSANEVRVGQVNSGD